MSLDSLQIRNGNYAISHIEVTQPQIITIKLNDNNYLMWKQQVLAAVRGYGLEEYLTGEITIPERFLPCEHTEQLTMNPVFQAYQRQDQMLASWLLSSLTEGILVLMVGLTTSHEIFQAIEVNFARQCRARMMQYKFQLQSLKKGNLPMREYLGRIKVLCDNLASAGQRLTEEDQILHMLLGLGSEYDYVIASIISRVEPYSLKDVCALLLSFESTLESISCHNRGRGGRFEGGGISCQICHGHGHSAGRCRHRFDVNFTPQNGNQSNRNGGNGNRFNNLSQVNHNVSVSDSGSSSHVTCDLANLNIEYQGNNRLHIGM